jgi:hypothetical protein
VVTGLACWQLPFSPGGRKHEASVQDAEPRSLGVVGGPKDIGLLDPAIPVARPTLSHPKYRTREFLLLPKPL